jgi:hypothetical protein
LIVSQHVFRNKPLNPSGPGDLSIGINLMTSSISALVKGCDNSSRPATGEITVDKSNCILGESQVPSLSLKDSKISFSFSAWSVIMDLSGRASVDNSH